MVNKSVLVAACLQKGGWVVGCRMFHTNAGPLVNLSKVVETYTIKEHWRVETLPPIVLLLFSCASAHGLCVTLGCLDGQLEQPPAN